MVGVVDVGGGSTEIAVGTLAGGVHWSSSFLVGSGALADRYLRSDPPSLDELRAVREHALRRVRRARRAAHRLRGRGRRQRRLAAAPRRRRARRATRCARAIGALSGAPAAEVAERLALDARRVRLLPAGIVILDAAAEQLRQPLQIGRGGLREGVVLDMARSL